MSFPKYEAYKNSGVEWVDVLPSHWDVASLRLLSKIFAGGTPDKSNLDFWTDGSIPWLNSGSVNQGLITEPSSFITADAYERSSAKWISEGALVIALAGQGKTKGMVAQLGIKATCNQSMAAIIPNTKISARYIYWWLTNNYQNIRNLAGGDLRDGLNLEMIGSISTPIPPFLEQAHIARFLDYETARIDALISEQQRLIELLKEKRQTVISHAVTKGLDPTAPMKDSGVEWLGQVPAHWEVVALKHLVSQPIIDGPHESPQKRDDGVPFISAESIGKGFIDFDKKWGYISEDDHEKYSQRYSPQRGDILLIKLGATTGVSALVETDVEFNVWVPLAAIRLKSHYQPRFIFHVLRSNNLRVAYELNWTYGTQQTLGLGTISNLRMPLPPSDEQQEIVEYLGSVLPRFDSLESEAERAIELLQERRSALISAAVTGKIDVRGWHAPASASPAPTLEPAHV